MSQNLPKVLLADKLAASTVAALGDKVTTVWVDGTNRVELLAAVKDADALLVRSATKVDAEVIAAAERLKIIARAGVGLDNVDISAATAKGILVVNAPYSNIHSAAEHSIALLLALARKIPTADHSLRLHTWKRNELVGIEIFNKTVGIIGLGKIGQLVAARLAAFEAKIIAYDPYLTSARAAQLGVELVDLSTLLKTADFISIHLPKTPETIGLIGAKELELVKPEVIFINAARGGLIVEKDLIAALKQGKIAGVGIDVYETEPNTASELFELSQTVVTPHLGASTIEAQDRAGLDVAKSVLLALAGEFVPEAVNISGGPVNEEVTPWLSLVKKLGRLVGKLAEKPITTLVVKVFGELAAAPVEVLKLAALQGFFSEITDQKVTLVNTPALIQARGITTQLQTQTESASFRSMVQIMGLFADGTDITVSGTLSGLKMVEKIVSINGRNFDLRAQGINLLLSYADKPGVLGKVGTLLGEKNIDIKAAALSENISGSGATMILRLDNLLDLELQENLQNTISVNKLVQIDFDRDS